MYISQCQRGGAVVRMTALIALACTLMLALVPVAPRDHQAALPAMPPLAILLMPH